MEPCAVSFENTENAFAVQADKALKKSRFLFSVMRYPLLVKIGTRITPWAIKAGIPLKWLIRNTIFDQFVGGETLEQTALVTEKLCKFKVQVILDYGVEGKEGEVNLEKSCEGFIKVIQYASRQPDIPFVSIKVTGFARFALLEKLDSAATKQAGYTGKLDTDVLTEVEKKEWQRVADRMNRIMTAAAAGNVGVLVDAEETWVQDPVDALTMRMMQKYNKVRAVVFNTIQLYRSDRLGFLEETCREADANDFIAGVKLVRGAYMEKERKRAREMNYPSPVQPDKASSDRDYNNALQFAIKHLSKFSLIIASHNEESNLLALSLMKEKGLPANDPRIHFSQLFGMSDNITFNLAAAGYNVSKYLPFGPVNDVIPYLMRRAQENSSVSGQTGRELALIKKEINRRGI